MTLRTGALYLVLSIRKIKKSGCTNQPAALVNFVCFLFLPEKAMYRTLGKIILVTMNGYSGSGKGGAELQVCAARPEFDSYSG